MTDPASRDGHRLFRWCFLLAMLLMATPAPAQELAFDTTSAVSPRIPSEDVRMAYLEDSRFHYAPDDGPLEEAGLWARFKAWLRGLLRDLGETTGDVLNTGILIGSAVLVVMLIIQLFVMRTRLPWHASGSGDEEDVFELEENGLPDFRARAAAARRAGDLRNAVRWLHRALLHELAERGLITYHPDETNGAFVRSVQEKAEGTLAEEVARATRQFEYIWYGGFEATEHEISTLEAAIDSVRTLPGNAS